MDFDRPEEKQLKNQSSWIPATPLKPSIPKPPVIFTGNPIDQRSWLGSGWYSTDQCFDASSQAEINVGLNLREEVLPAESYIGSETPGERLGDGVARFNEFSFRELLALADAASATSTSVAEQEKDNAASSFSVQNSPVVGNKVDCNPTNNWLWNKIGANPSTNRNSMEKETQNKLPSSHQHGFDLYFARGARMEDALFSFNTSQFAPAAPEKAIRVEKEHFPEAQNLCTREMTSKEIDEENAKSIAGFENNDVQCEKETPNSVTDPSIAAVSTPLKENHSPDKGGRNGIDLDEMLQQKPTRKKHRPKVITEGKPRARKSVIPKLDISKENPTGKRKYVRRKSLNKASPEKCKEPNDTKDMESTKKSCRRALNFDLEGQPQNKRPTGNLESETRMKGTSTEGNQPKSTVHLGQGIEIVIGTTETGIANDLSCSVNQTLDDYISLPEKQAAPNTPLPAKMKTPWRKTNVRTQEAINNDREGQVAANKGPKNITDTKLPTQAHSPLGTSNFSYCSTRTTCNEVGNAGVSKRKYSKATQPAESSSTNLEGIHSNSVHAYQMKFPLHFPNIHKKKRSEKGQNSTTSSTSSSMTMEKRAVSEQTRSENDAKATSTASEANNWTFSSQQVSGESKDAGGLQNKLRTLEDIMTSSHMERKTKRRSRGPIRVRDLASLTKIMKSKMHPTSSARQETRVHDRAQVNSHRPHTCIADLVAEIHATLARKKRTTKRNRLPSPTFSSTHELQPYHKIALYDQDQSLGAPILWREMLSIDAIVERLKHLDINREGSSTEHREQNALVPYGLRNKEHNALVPYGRRNQERNALVLYRRDGTIVPFEGSFDPIKKRRPRPKVDLDEETNRVWKLLLQDINSEGIDGTDEDKENWWDEERRVFRGRADSFIARMHLVQGDRRFSQWKGSVVDSVIGVFLTQNVSDHLSSSAFMSMASRFPKISEDNYKSCHEEGTSSAIEEPSLCILGHKEQIQWNEISNHRISDQQIQRSMTHHESRCNEEEEAANISESFGSSCNVVCLTNEPRGKNFDSTKSCQGDAYDSTMSRITPEIMGPETTSHEVLDGTAPNDLHSSQDSTVSFCNSGDPPVAQNAERKESFSEISTGAENMTEKSSNGSTSFVELLQMAGSKTLHETYSRQISNENSMECIQPITAESDDQRQKIENLDGPRSFLRMLMTPSSNYCLHLTPNSEVLEVDYFESFREGTLSSDLSKKKNECDNTNKNALTAESASQTVNPTILTAYVPETPQYTGKHDQSCNKIQEDNMTIIEPQSELINEARMFVEALAQAQNYKTQSGLALPNISEVLDVTESTAAFDDRRKRQQLTTKPDMNKQGDSRSKEIDKKNAANIKAKSRRVGKEIKNDFNWEDLRKLVEASGKKRERTTDTMDSVDWEAVRRADVSEIAQTIRERGMNNMLAERIKAFLDRVVIEHGNIDLEWLRDVPPDKAKEYLLSIRGLGLKSVECVRLLTLHHLAFPVDTNVGRIAVRLGWVPLQPLPESLQLHLLELYPVLESIQKYLWPRLCKLDQRTLYELHYQMITFGKVFCTKSKPNCNACPMRGECRHFASAFASARLALPAPDEKSIVVATENRTDYQTPTVIINQEMLHLTQTTEKQQSGAVTGVNNCEPIIEEPTTPEPECTQDQENDIEDTLCEDPDEIPMIKLNIEEFTQNLQNYMQQNMELQEGDISKALVALTSEAACIPTPKLKNVSRLRTEHQVYELPDSHPLLEGLEERQPDDPCSYLLAIWTPGETASSFQPPESKCSSQEYGQLCHDSTCFSCNSTKEDNAQIVRGTLLIPCRTAMRGSFPLNGTYFQVNEVFADHDSSLNPIDVPRAWIWNLPRRTVYFGTSIPTIFKGLTTEGIQHCFWRGYVCVRGFDQRTRAPRPLMARLHFPASKLRTKGKADEDDR